MSNELNAKKEVTVNQVINVPNHYFNGFQIGISSSDMSVLLMNNGMPQANLNMSYTTAKSLLTFLQQSVEELEEITGHELMTTEYIESKLRETKESRKK